MLVPGVVEDHAGAEGLVKGAQHLRGAREPIGGPDALVASLRQSAHEHIVCERAHLQRRGFRLLLLQETPQHAYHRGLLRLGARAEHTLKCARGRAQTRALHPIEQPEAL